MPTFAGFPGGKLRMTPVPALFFTDLLPQIDHLGELKICLYALWLLDRQEGKIRYFSLGDCLADERLARSFGAGDGHTQGVPGEEPRAAVLDALERAVHRGVLIAVEFEERPADENIYFLNSPRGRAAVEALRQGEWSLEQIEHYPVALGQERPNIYRLYEENIGALTPLMVDILRDAEQEYPQEWIEEAVRAAVENNARKWRYVEAILRTRKENGRYE